MQLSATRRRDAWLMFAAALTTAGMGLVGPVAPWGVAATFGLIAGWPWIARALRAVWGMFTVIGRLFRRKRRRGRGSSS